MSALIQPVALLLIILAGYLFKRAGLFEDRDYRIMQTIIFQSGAARRDRLFVCYESA